MRKRLFPPVSQLNPAALSPLAAEQPRSDVLPGMAQTPFPPVSRPNPAARFPLAAEQPRNDILLRMTGQMRRRPFPLFHSQTPPRARRLRRPGRRTAEMTRRPGRCADAYPLLPAPCSLFPTPSSPAALPSKRPSPHPVGRAVLIPLAPRPDGRIQTPSSPSFQNGIPEVPP
ncbi:hypothetical protein HMPREF0262_00975 [Clostridium sp. ATCC 29733]|nr:hypothetical protein HMPREF0262_00975 [Clostridium sp. ATCC 29733]